MPVLLDLFDVFSENTIMCSLLIAEKFVSESGNTGFRL